MSDLEIKEVNYHDKEHADALILLMKGYSGDVMGGDKTLSDAIVSTLPQALAERTDVYSVIAWAGSTPAGLITAFEGFSTFRCMPLFNIHDVYVAPEYRKSGAASRLLAHIEEEAKLRGYCKLTLEVLEGNTPAKSLYTSKGFKQYSLLEETGNAIFLEKDISV